MATSSADEVLGVLRTPAQFAALAAARGTSALRGARRWLAMTAVVVDTAKGTTDDGGRPLVRYGLIVPKRLARRAIDRNLVKRVARQALRAATPTLAGVVLRRRVDVVLRLKAPLPPSMQLSRRQFKQQVRREADALLATLAHDLRIC